jgi:elongation factor Ts
MSVSAQEVKELRDKTGAGFMECKAALTETHGDVEKAVDLLRKKGLSSAAKKAGRETREGIIGSYIHVGGKVGVLVEVNCESDFVARTADFQELVKDLAMQIAAADPRFIRREDVTPEVLEKEREIYMEQAKSTGKPKQVLEKIVDGKIEKYYSEACLMEQPFIKDPKVTIHELISAKVSKVGENIRVNRFARFKIGE